MPPTSFYLGINLGILPSFPAKKQKKSILGPFLSIVRDINVVFCAVDLHFVEIAHLPVSGQRANVAGFSRKLDWVFHGDYLILLLSPLIFPQNIPFMRRKTLNVLVPHGRSGQTAVVLWIHSLAPPQPSRYQPLGLRPKRGVLPSSSSFHLWDPCADGGVLPRTSALPALSGGHP